MTGRRRVVGTDNDFDLGENVGGGGGVGDNEVDGSHTLAVPEKRGRIREVRGGSRAGGKGLHAHVLGEALSDDHLKSLHKNIRGLAFKLNAHNLDLLHKVSESPSVRVEGAGGVALIRTVKQHLPAAAVTKQCAEAVITLGAKPHHERAGADGVANSDPLVARRIEASGVVGTGVEDLGLR